MTFKTRSECIIKESSIEDFHEKLRFLLPISKKMEKFNKRRKVRTCCNCRRLKVQCDQVAPTCGRCIKTGQADSCVYPDSTRDASSTSGWTSADVVPKTSRVTNLDTTDSSAVLGTLSFHSERFGNQEERIRALEAEMISIKNASVTPQSSRISTSTLQNGQRAIETITESEKSTLKGGSFKTRFYGLSYPESLISYIPDFAALSKEIVEQNPCLIKARHLVQSIEPRPNKMRVTRLPVTYEDLVALLPDRCETDEIVGIYLESYDEVYHIIHRPSFRKEYESLWSNRTQARPHFVVLLLLMLACARCTQRREPHRYVGKHSQSREAALLSIQYCQEWLKTQSQKQVSVTDFQIRFLLNLAKSANSMELKRSWADAGSTLKFCIAAGLHVNPASLTKVTSGLDKELRCRIWCATAEFELQQAVGRGIPWYSFEQQNDTAPPGNIHDHDLTTDDEQSDIPSKPLSEYTRTSCLVFLHSTHTMRRRFNKILNSPQPLDSNDVRSFTADIETQISRIPSWNDKDGLPMASNVFLHFILRQLLLILHNRYLVQSTSTSEKDYSKSILMNQAMEILNRHAALSSRNSCITHTLRQDQLRLALSVCHVFAASRDCTSFVLKYGIDHYAEPIISDIVEMLAEDTDCLGAGHQRLWIALVAKALVRIQKNPPQKSLYIQEAVQRMEASYYKILACQVSKSSGEPNTEHRWRDRRSDVLVVHSNENAEPVFGAVDTSVSAIDFDAISPWIFEEWVNGPP